jgi:excisionase family DNA binding protein
MTDIEQGKAFERARAITGIDYSKIKEGMNLQELVTAGIPTILSEPTAAQLLGISNLTLQRARKRGEISFLQIGRRVLYTGEQIVAYVASVECKNATKQPIEEVMDQGEISKCM